MIATALLSLMIAAPERAGLFIGSNAAPPGRTPLQHAESDAREMRRVFVELGGLAPEDAHLLESPSADTILDAIKHLAGPPRVLIFYYSGHADARALLLDGSELSFLELDRALAAAGAELRLELVDACRSGAMTRNKGATLGERLQLAAGEPGEHGEGRIVITSSAEWEDAHESDQLGGSFFTVHMKTGLRGAADVDRDGQVTLAEAYRYVYGRTVESTIGSGAGVQHPSFAYALSGRGELVLTRPIEGGASATLVFNEGEYLLIDGATGRVAAEVTTPGTKLTLPPGNYRAHKRTRAEVWSGPIQLARGTVFNVDDALVEREAYARLVRKGRDDDPRLAHSLRLMGGVRGRVAAELDAVPSFRAGYELSLPWFSVMPYLSATLGAGVRSPRLAWTTHELGAGVLVSRALDLPILTLRTGLLAEAIRFSQSEAAERERSRAGFGAVLGAQLAVESRPIAADFFLTAAVEAALYIYRSTGAALEPAGEGELVTRPAYRALIGTGYEF